MNESQLSYQRVRDFKIVVVTIAKNHSDRAQMSGWWVLGVINLWNENGFDGVDKDQTLMWGKDREDGGRGVGFTGGHYHRNWGSDGFRQLVLNAVVWVAGMDVPTKGVKSNPLTEDELNANLDVYKGKENPRIPLPDIEAFKKIPPAKWVGAAEMKVRKAKMKKQREERLKRKKSKQQKKEAEKSEKAAS